MRPAPGSSRWALAVALGIGLAACAPEVIRQPAQLTAVAGSSRLRADHPGRALSRSIAGPTSSAVSVTIVAIAENAAQPAL